MCPPRRFGRLLHCRHWLQGLTLGRLCLPLLRPSKRVRDVAAHPEHVSLDELEVVNATAPQRCKHHLHDPLCQILGFRYTAEVAQPVEPRALPKPPA